MAGNYVKTASRWHGHYQCFVRPQTHYNISKFMLPPTKPSTKTYQSCQGFAEAFARVVATIFQTFRAFSASYDASESFLNVALKTIEKKAGRAIPCQDSTDKNSHDPPHGTKEHTSKVPENHTLR